MLDLPFRPYMLRKPMKALHKTFGKMKDFQIGDLVWWTDLKKIKKRTVGIIHEIKKELKGGREVLIAKVYCVETQEYKQILLAILHKVEDEN
jgi:hypothetical protein